MAESNESWARRIATQSRNAGMDARTEGPTSVRVGSVRSLEDELQAVAEMLRKDSKVDASSVAIDAAEPIVRFVTKDGERMRIRVEARGEPK